MPILLARLAPEPGRCLPVWVALFLPRPNISFASASFLALSLPIQGQMILMLLLGPDLLTGLDNGIEGGNFGIRCHDGELLVYAVSLSFYSNGITLVTAFHG